MSMLTSSHKFMTNEQNEERETPEELRARIEALQNEKAERIGAIEAEVGEKIGQLLDAYQAHPDVQKEEKERQEAVFQAGWAEAKPILADMLLNAPTSDDIPYNAFEKWVAPLDQVQLQSQGNMTLREFLRKYSYRGGVNKIVAAIIRNLHEAGDYQKREKVGDTVNEFEPIVLPKGEK